MGEYSHELSVSEVLSCRRITPDERPAFEL